MLFLDKNPDLNETDFVIYKHIMANIYDIKKTSIRELAEATHTSTASVLRFCKKFGTTGYSEFKILLENHIKNISTQKILDTYNYEDELINFISRSREEWFNDRLEESAYLLMEKELIVFIGVGSSKIVAEYGALYFSSIFNMALHIDDPTNYPINYLSSELAQKMCVIALSVSGETKEVLDYLNHLNLSESSVITVTNNMKSTVSRLSDISIPYFISVEKVNSADITTQIPAMFIIEKLAKKVRKLKLALPDEDAKK